MAIIPENVTRNGLSRTLREGGLSLHHRGKVRDTWRLPNGMLLVVATDRISVFDIVLPTTIANKGAVLTALTVFWLTTVLARIKSHLVAYGAGIDRYLPMTLRGLPDLQCRALVVMQFEMLPIECIVRRHLTGSGWVDYQKTGAVCGHKLEGEVWDGAQLPAAIFTPSTKATRGHDINIEAARVEADYGAWPRERSLEVFELAYGYAAERGIIVADTKLEWGQEGLADEVFTPDSSRFWKRSDYETSRRTKLPPPSHDKELVRTFCKQIETPFSGKDGQPLTLNKLDNTSGVQMDWVAKNVVLPDALKDLTSNTYLEMVRVLAGKELPEFQRSNMGIAA